MCTEMLTKIELSFLNNVDSSDTLLAKNFMRAELLAKVELSLLFFLTTSITAIFLIRDRNLPSWCPQVHACYKLISGQQRRSSGQKSANLVHTGASLYAC